MLKQGQLPLTAGYPIATERSQRLAQWGYEIWLRKHLDAPPSQSSSPTTVTLGSRHDLKKKGSDGGHLKEVDGDDVNSADLEEEAKETLARMAPKFM